MSVVSAHGNTLICVGTSGRSAAQPDPEPGQPGAGDGSAAASAAAGPDTVGRATDAFRVGDSCLTMGDVAVRVSEDLYSPCIMKLTDGHAVGIIEIGTFETGRRAKIRTNTLIGGSVEGWVSVAMPSGVPKLQRVVVTAAPPTSKALPAPKRQRHMY